MEFSLGFFGGLGMIYGVYSREWPKSISPSKKANGLALLFLVLLLPATNIIQAFETDTFSKIARNIGITDSLKFAHTQIIYGWLLLGIIAIVAVVVWRRSRENQTLLTGKVIPGSFFIYSVYYILLSHIIKGISYRGYQGQSEQFIYWVILLIIITIWFVDYRKKSNAFFIGPKESYKRWIVILVVFLFIIAVLTYISINSHTGFAGAHERF